jgi:hypothetical protein
MLYKLQIKPVNFLHILGILIMFGLNFFLVNLNTFAQVPNVEPPKIAPSVPGAPLTDDSKPLSSSSSISSVVSSVSSSSVSVSSSTNSISKSTTNSTPTKTPVTEQPSGDFLPKETPRTGGAEVIFALTSSGAVAGLGYFYKQNFWKQKKKLTTTENKIKNHF